MDELFAGDNKRRMLRR